MHGSMFLCISLELVKLWHRELVISYVYIMLYLDNH